MSLLLFVTAAAAASTTSTKVLPASSTTSTTPETTNLIVASDGLPINENSQWGLRASPRYLDSPDIGNVSFAHLVLGINNSAIPAGYGDDNTTLPTTLDYIFDYSQGVYPYYQPAPYTVPVPRGHDFSLGPNSTFKTVTSLDSGKGTVQDAYASTLPFGVNLGAQGYFPGSLTFGGSYDAARLAADKWNQLHFAGGNADAFLYTGRQELDVNASNIIIGTHKTNSSPQRVIVDFNADAIILTSGAQVGTSCNQNLTIHFGNEIIIITDYMLGTNFRCRLNTPGVENGTVVLGRPFFQAAYLFAHQNRSVYVAQAFSGKTTPQAQSFDGIDIKTSNQVMSTVKSGGPSRFSRVLNSLGLLPVVALVVSVL